MLPRMSASGPGLRARMHEDIAAFFERDLGVVAGVILISWLPVEFTEWQ